MAMALSQVATASLKDFVLMQAFEMFYNNTTFNAFKLPFSILTVSKCINASR